MATQERDYAKLAQEAFIAAGYDVIQIAEATGTPILIWEDGIQKDLTPQEARKRLELAKQESAGPDAVVTTPEATPR